MLQAAGGGSWHCVRVVFLCFHHGVEPLGDVNTATERSGGVY